MTNRLLFTLPLLVVLSAQAEDFDTVDKKLSYIFGAQVGSQIEESGVELDREIFMMAIEDALAGKQSRLSQQQIQTTIQEYQKLKAEAEQLAAAKMKVQGEKFLDENKTKPDVVTLSSGLQYKVIRAGSGKSPAATDTVEVNYRGTLIDGTEFDSSYSRGQTATFPVNRVIKGWTEALQLMKEGAQWQLFIPSDLAYGERGSGGKIGPHATLIFDVELIAVK